jgi:hypothetical protein
MIILGSTLLHANKKWPLLRISVIALCIAGFYINLSGILIWFQYGLMYGWQKMGLALYPNSLDIITWYPSYSPLILHTRALLDDYVSTINPAQYVNTSWYWAAYGNAPCPVDFYIYCNSEIPMFLTLLLILLLVLVLVSFRLEIIRNRVFKPLLHDIVARRS